ncbi:MAG: hypothetical protein EOP11_15970 [Proteobacteria bacterium]|nr:MAG: hypothetical protein EOP11_15970 [Pseudomonadota bacterium]
MGLLVAAAGSAYRNFVMTADSFRVARVKNLMSGVEAQARVLSQQPEAYVNCNSNSTADCSLNAGFFSELSLRIIPGADCPGGVGTCGITLTNLAYDASHKVFTGLVTYQGREIAVKPIPISQTIPVEVLQMDNFHCGERDKDRPIFTGFDSSSGAPICVGFPACPNGYYAGDMAVSGHNLTCKPLPPTASCGGESYFSSLGWGGSGPLNTSCAPTEPPPFHGSASGSAPGPMAAIPPPPTLKGPDPVVIPPDPVVPEPPSPGCVVTNETSQGFKRTPAGSVYYYNGADAFCSFQSPQHLKNYSGKRPEDAEAVAAMPSCKANHGPCPDPGCDPGPTGPVRLNGGVWFNNGSAYCLYTSPQHLQNATGVTDIDSLPTHPGFPVCFDDHGICTDPGPGATPTPTPTPTAPTCPTDTMPLYEFVHYSYGYYYALTPNPTTALSLGYTPTNENMSVFTSGCGDRELLLECTAPDLAHYLGNGTCGHIGSSTGDGLGYISKVQTPQANRFLSRYFLSMGTRYIRRSTQNGAPGGYSPEGGQGWLP